MAIENSQPSTPAPEGQQGDRVSTSQESSEQSKNKPAPTRSSVQVSYEGPEGNVRGFQTPYRKD